MPARHLQARKIVVASVMTCVTLPCEKILIFLLTLFWDSYFTGIRKKFYYFNTLFTKPDGSPSKGNPYNKQPRCYLLNSCFVVNFKSEQIVHI